MPQINGLNYVTVTGTMITQAGAPSSGSLYFEASDLVWNSAAPFVGSLDPVGVTLPASGLLSVPLLAMDNAGLSATWNWILSVSLNGITYAKRKLIVLYSLGDSQDIAKLLNTATVL